MLSESLYLPIINYLLQKKYTQSFFRFVNLRLFKAVTKTFKMNCITLMVSKSLCYFLELEDNSESDYLNLLVFNF